jgi:hypothetical protein
MGKDCVGDVTPIWLITIDAQTRLVNGPRIPFWYTSMFSANAVCSDIGHALHLNKRMQLQEYELLVCVVTHVHNHTESD